MEQYEVTYHIETPNMAMRGTKIVSGASVQAVLFGVMSWLNTAPVGTEITIDRIVKI